MLSQPKTRVQAIKSKFENLNLDKSSVSKQTSQLYKIKNDKENKLFENINYESDMSSGECVKPNDSYLYKNDVKRSASDSKTVISRQCSDPGKKLQRSHAFRCDRTQISPKRHSSCSRSSMDRKLSKDKLKRLGDFLEVQMKKENFVPPLQCSDQISNTAPIVSIPDENVPKHILAQYSKVLKPKKQDDKQEAMTDSGVSSETENVEDDRISRVNKLKSQFEPDKTEILQDKEISTNLDVMEDLAGSSETMKLERKNPHVTLTDTLKKALKQPLPAGPPPKKPPRTFTAPTLPENIEIEKKDMQRKLEKLEQVLLKREAVKKDKNIYDIAEEDLSSKRPKEIHYLCTEILDIMSRTLLPNQNVSPLKTCLNKLNCTMSNSMASLPYSRLSSNLDTCLNTNNNELSSTENLISNKCLNCQKNSSFKSHIECTCIGDEKRNSEFYVDHHIYDEPFVDEGKKERKNKYGTLNSVAGSKSLEDLQKMPHHR